MERKVAVGGTEAGDHEVVLEGTYRAFGGVATVHVWGNQLEVNVLADHVAFESGGCLVVESLKLGSEATGAEKIVGAFVGGEDFGASLRFHGLDVDEVAVIVVDDQHVAVAVGGGLDEATSEVGEDLTGRRCEVGVDVVSAESGRRCGRRMKIGGDVGVGGGRRDGSGVGGVDGGGRDGSGVVGVFVVVAFCGLEVGTLLVEVAFDHRDGWWRMATNLGRG